MSPRALPNVVLLLLWGACLTACASPDGAPLPRLVEAPGLARGLVEGFRCEPAPQTAPSGPRTMRELEELTARLAVGLHMCIARNADLIELVAPESVATGAR